MSTAGVAVGESRRLEPALRRQRALGRKLLVPYVTGGMLTDWTTVLAALATAGADAIEVGIPFSDPIMDGPVIQEASDRALAAGTTPQLVLAALRHAGGEIGVPLAVMTYYNLVDRAGLDRFAADLAASGVGGAILPDLPLDESGPWRRAAAAAGVDQVLLAAPTTGEERLAAICSAASGFLYAVGLMGVTGERADLATSSLDVATRASRYTDLPVLVGVGISTPDQARRVCAVADGVVVGSALVRRLLEGGGPEAAAALVSEFREALDAG